MGRCFVALRITGFFLGSLFGSFHPAQSQIPEKIVFDQHDPANGYYIAVPPVSGAIRAVVVLFGSYRPPEAMLAETKLHNVAAAGDLLTVYASLGPSFYADSAAVSRIQTVLAQVAEKYPANADQLILGGFDDAGGVVLRFTEMAYAQRSARKLSLPKAVFAVAATVDLTSHYHWCRRQIAKNFYPPAVGDAHFYLDKMNKEIGNPAAQADRYRSLSPFDKNLDSAGNERWLTGLPVRLYYDVDVNWHLNTRRNSLYDTNIPDATELINRLQLAGNSRAEFVVARTPGMRSNGVRSPNALSVMDEVDCIQWVKRTLHLLDPSNPRAWVAPYQFPVPDGWTVETTYFPPPFAPHVALKGIEDIRFPPGWGKDTSAEYWSVSYLFWLDAGQTISASVLTSNLTTYYTELVSGGLQRRNVNWPAEKIPPVSVKLVPARPEWDDSTAYAGTISMLDYIGQKPMVLHCQLHILPCGKAGKTAVFLEISPKEFGHPVWKALRKTREGFKCGD